MIQHLKILEYALSSLSRRKGKNCAIIIVYALTIATLASVLFLTHSLREEAGKVLLAAPDLVVQRLVAGRHDLVPTEYAQTIRKIPGVGKVEPRVWGYYYDGLTKANYTFVGLQDAPEELELLEGRLPRQAGECAIGSGVADIRLVGVGDDLILIDSQNMGTIFEITGRFKTESNLLANDLIVFPEDNLRAFFALPAGRVTDISVEVFNEREVSKIAEKIKRQLPDSRPITKSELLRTYDGVFNWRSGMILTVFASALIAFCVLAWDKATGISADEKQEVGILKAIGWDTKDILELKFWEGLIVSFSSLLLGLIFAYVHVFFLGASVLSAVIKGWSVLFPDFHLTPYVDLYQVFALAFLTVAPYVASTLIPSWKTAITDPETIMRR